jgi:hypothetical protein
LGRGYLPLGHDDDVGAHSFLQIGNELLLACREGYLPELAAVFDESDRRLVLEDDPDPTDSHVISFGYESTVGRVRDRLQVLGFTRQRALAELDRVIQQRKDLPEPLAREYEPEIPLRDEVIHQLHELVRAGPEDYGTEEPEILVELDPRVSLRLAVDEMADDAVLVRLNLDDLSRRGLLDCSLPIAEQAHRELSAGVARDASLVVLTEGSSDSQLLSLALSVTHPHLVGFLTFMDFGYGAQGSAGDLAKLVRAFAGAGIANRVVALADNDTAGRDALRQLRQVELPANYRVLHYPDLPLLENYPTLGPQSDEPVVMNVIGLAGSLELYLGQDVLTADGELRPVHGVFPLFWTPI